MMKDLEVKIVVTNQGHNFFRRIICADEDAERYYKISEMSYDPKKNTLDTMEVFNAESVKVCETKFTWLQNIHRYRSQLPSGCIFDIGFAIDYETDEWIPSSFSYTDVEERRHGFGEGPYGRVRWSHGYPMNSHKMYLYEEMRLSEGRAYFFPLKDGYYVVDYYYGDYECNYYRRLFNIYRIDPSGSACFVFEKGYDHSFSIVETGGHKRYIDYHIPVEFVFKDHLIPTADEGLYKKQKAAALAFIDSMELPSEEYDKSARHYEHYREYANGQLMRKEDKDYKEWREEEVWGDGEVWGDSEDEDDV